MKKKEKKVKEHEVVVNKIGYKTIEPVIRSYFEERNPNLSLKRIENILAKVSHFFLELNTNGRLKFDKETYYIPLDFCELIPYMTPAAIVDLSSYPEEAIIYAREQFAKTPTVFSNDRHRYNWFIRIVESYCIAKGLCRNYNLQFDIAKELGIRLYDERGLSESKIKGEK
jgi:hypothetical protein